jgi:hypothetical protein
MSDAEFKEKLLKFGGINSAKGTVYLQGNARMLGDGSYMSQLTVKDMVVTGNAVIPGISFDSLTVAGNVVSTDGNFIGNGALMTGVISTPPPEANIDISGNVVGAYARVDDITSTYGNIGNVRMSGGNISASGQVNIRGNAVAGYFVGNGSRLDSVKVSGIQIIDIVGNARGEYANVNDLIVTTGNIGGVVMAGGNVSVSGQVNALGNVVAEYVIGNGAFLTGILTKLPTIANVDIRGNITGTYINVSNVIATLGNIGNVLMSGGNVFISGNLRALGTITAKYFIGNGALLTNVILPLTDDTDIRGNVIGTYANVVDVIATFGNVGNVKMGNAGMRVSGQVNVLGNVTSEYVIGNGALLIDMAIDGTQSIDIIGNVDGTYANVDDITATSGNVGNVGMVGSNVSVDGQMIVIGNVTANYFIGNGVLLSNIVLPPIANIGIRGNVIGSYANVGQIVATAGNVGNVRMENGDVSVSGQVSVRENVDVRYITSNGALMNAMNILGDVVAGNVVVVGNVTAERFIGNGSSLYDVVATRTPPTANVDIIGNATGSYANVGQITAIAGNVGNVHMENSSMLVNGTMNVNGNVTAEYFIGNGAFLTNILASGVQTIGIMGNVDGAYANVEQVIAPTGNVGNVEISGGNIIVSGDANIAGNVTASYFIGNGALLTDVSGSRRYLSARRGTNQKTSGSWKDVIVVMDSVVENNNIPYNAATGVFTLQAGVTYRITAQLAWEASAAKTYEFRLINVATTEQIGVRAVVYPPRSNTRDTSGAVLDVIYTPDMNTNCYLQISNTNADGNQEIRFDVGTFLNIVEVNGGVVSTGLPSRATATTQGNLVGTSVIVGNLIASTFGNVGNIIMEKGNVAASGQVNIIGNVEANCFIGIGSQLKDVIAVGTHSIDIEGNVNMGRYINVHRISAPLGGNVGNVLMENGNMDVRGQVNILGNVTAMRFIGDGSLLKNISVGNANIDIIGNVGDGTRINVHTLTATTFGNIANVIIEKGNVTASGQVYIVGSVTADYFIGNGALLTGVKVFGIQNINIWGNVEGANVNVVSNMYAINGDIGGVRMENGCVTAISGILGNARIENGNVHATGQVDVTGNVVAGSFFGNGSQLTKLVPASIQRTDIKGNVGNGIFINVSDVRAINVGNIANIILRRGNITANCGNIGGIILANNIHVGQVNVRGNVRANCFIGNGVRLTNVLPGGKQDIDIQGNVTSGTYVNVSTIAATMFGNIANVTMENGNVTANIGNVGFVWMESGNVTAGSGIIGGIRMEKGNVSVSGQVNVRGNIVANVFIGDGSKITGIVATYVFPPRMEIDVIGNLRGTYTNVHFIQATAGNIGNIRMVGDNVSASGQVNVVGNIVGNVCDGDIISVFGNIGNTRMIGGNAIVGGQVNVRGNVVARNFIGNGLMLSNVGSNVSWLSLIMPAGTDKRCPAALWVDNPTISNNLMVISQSATGVVYETDTGKISLTPGIPYRITAQMGFICVRDTSILDLLQFGLYSLDEKKMLTVAQPLMRNDIPSASVFGTSCPIFDIIIVPRRPATGGLAAYDVRFPDYSVAGTTEEILDGGTFINVVSLTNGSASTLVQNPLQNKARLELTTSTQNQDYSWSLTGKIMRIKGYYSIPENNNHAGVIEYLMNIPGGHAIDTSVTGVAPTSITEGIPVGQIQLRTVSSQYTGEVLVYDESNVKFIIWSPADNKWVPVDSGLADIRSLYFTAEVPIQ